MALIKYDISLSPPKPKVTLGISAELTSDTGQGNNSKDLCISVEVDDIDISVSVKPTPGTVVGGAIAGFLLGPFGTALTVDSLYGVGELIENQLQSKIPEGIKGQKKDNEIGHLGYTIKVEGVDINIEAETLNLSTHNGMLMATGTVKVN